MNKSFYCWSLLLSALLLTILARATPVHAQSPDTTQLTTNITVWKKRLDRIDYELKNAPSNEHLLSRVARELEQYTSTIKKFTVQNTPLAKAAKTRLDKLGKAPKKGEPSESKAIAQQRSELEQDFAQIDGPLRSATSMLERSAQMREIVHDLRRKLFIREVLKKGESPFSLALWQRGGPALASALNDMTSIMQRWSKQHSSAQFGLILLAALLLGGLLAIAMHRGIEIYRRTPHGPPPDFFKQVASASIVSMMRAAPPVFAAVFVYGLADIFDMTTPPIDELAPIALGAVCAIAVIIAISTSLLAPQHPLWRIFPVTSPVAIRLNILIIAIAIIYGIDLFLGALNTTLLLPLSLTILQSAISSVVFVALLIAILRTPLRPHQTAGSTKGINIARLLKIPLWGIVFGVLTATALGYISLARFLTQQIVVTGSIVIIAYLAYLSIHEFTNSFEESEKPAGNFLSLRFDMNQQRREQFGAIAMLALNALLVIFTLPFLALQWGFDWRDVSSWSRQALFGFEFGGLHISLAAIFIGIFIFFLGLLFTKIFQRWLDQRILSKNRSQTGAEDSIKTAVGYLGVILSVLVAISYTGISLGNLAIVAGALSVGIGFGLQSIVNNFVSGLILLVERPIKVGDWIGVAGEEGNVRRISVRSTEIETFDRSHIIIPNSELISGKVKNWTLRGPLGRVIIDIGVSYDVDPDKVHDILLNVAKQHPDVLDYPEPFVVLVDFGASSLDFSIRAYLSDITKSLKVRSQLRFEILRTLRRNNIEIPFPQSDIHLRDMNRLETALTPPSAPPQKTNNQTRRRRGKPDQSKNPPQSTKKHKD